MNDMATQTAAEDDGIWDAPAFYVNRVWAATLSGGTVRIAFGEQSGPEAAPRQRAAVVMSMEVAIAVADLMASVVAPFRGKRDD